VGQLAFACEEEGAGVLRGGRPGRV